MLATLVVVLAAILRKFELPAEKMRKSAEMEAHLRARDNIFIQ
jgi:hypothetical protein